MNAETYGNSLRTCGGCKASLLTMDVVSPMILCSKCRTTKPSFGKWADTLGPNDVCYLQPGCAKDPRFNRTRHVIISRDGEMLTVQPIGAPDFAVTVHVGNVADHDVTPWRGYALY